jgi:hypothetical protein
MSETGVVHEGLDGPQAEDSLKISSWKLFPLVVVERRLRLLGEDPLREAADLLLQELPVQGVDEREVQHVHQAIVYLAFQFAVLVVMRNTIGFSLGMAIVLSFPCSVPLLDSRMQDAVFPFPYLVIARGAEPTRQSRESPEIASIRSQ